MSLETSDLKKLLDQFDENQRKDIVAAMGSKANLPGDCTDSSEIAYRFRELGGNAIANKARGGGPSYQKIVNDVANIVEVLADGEPHEVEERILDSFLTVGLSRSDMNKSKQMVCEAADRAKEKFAGFWNKAKQGKVETGAAASVVTGFLARRAISAPVAVPAAVLSVGKAATDPDYDAVVPALVMIAGYRAIARFTIFSAESAQKTSKKSAGKYTYYPIAKSDDNTFTVEACVAETSKSVQWAELDKDAKEDISTLSAYIGNVPGMATAVDVHTTKYMIVKVNGNLAPSTTGNGGYRGYTKGPDGKIESHAELFDPDKLKKLVNFGAIFNIVSTVVAQAHLADINKKLGEIKNQLNDLKEARVNDRKAVITSVRNQYALWSGLGQDFNAGKRLSAIEESDRTLSVAANSILSDIEKEFDNLRKLDSDGEWFGSGDYHKDVELYCSSIMTLVAQWYFVMRLRVFGVQFLAMISGEEKHALVKYKNLHEEIMSRSYGSDFISGIDSIIREKVSGIKSSFNFASTLGARKASILGYSKSIIDLSMNIQNQLPDFNALSKVCNPKEKLLHVEYRNGEIVRIGAETSGLGI